MAININGFTICPLPELVPLAQRAPGLQKIIFGLRAKGWEKSGLFQKVLDVFSRTPSKISPRPCVKLLLKDSTLRKNDLPSNSSALVKICY